jgi:hypothetical protein
MVVDPDEFIYHKDILQALEGCKGKFDILRPDGYQMVSDEFSATEVQIYDEIKYGKKLIEYCKPVIFDPSTIKNMFFEPGCHWTWAKRIDGKLPKLVWRRGIKLFHCKYLGKDYVMNRYAQYAMRRSEANKAKNFGNHYSVESHVVEKRFERLKKQSKKVVKDEE